MVYYTIRRIGQIVIVFFVATFLIFAIVRILPGDPIQAQFGERRIPDNLRQAYVERYNLDEPLWKQYALYMQGIFTGDFGESISKQRPVIDIFREAFPRTARLAVLAVLFQAAIRPYQPEEAFVVRLQAGRFLVQSGDIIGETP